MNGVVLLNKPSGMTSFDAVRKCGRILNERKAGHTGTLDPEAEGLMILLFGKYTKMLPFCVSDRKSYHAGFSFGIKTDTEDIWGTVTDCREPSVHSEQELQKAADRLTGKIMQVPPMYSAIKKDGRKLYEYARKGIEVEREPREVTIYSLKVAQTGENLYEMDACVSSGTYIRTLITDYAASLNELGVMTSLFRNGIGDLTADEACTFEDLENGRGLIDPLKVVDPSFELLEVTDEKKVSSGMKIRLNGHGSKIMFVKEGQPYAAYEKQEDRLYRCLRGLW